MKQLYFSLVALLLSSMTHLALAQGATCATAAPFCTDNNYTFPASVNTDAESGPDYGCLGSQPNPAWYYIQIAQSGNLTIDLGSVNGTDDIDFICWGPFNTLSTACGNLTGGSLFSSCNLLGTYPCGNIVDCSYSINATETCTINGAVAGQYYMFLITNFANVQTDIFATTNTSVSTASTNCSIVPPPSGSCLITDFTANISACAPNNTFSIDGTFTYTDNPGSGTVIVEIDNGTSTYTQTFNPPFTDGQTYNYSIANVPADGASSTITVYFSADNTCSQTIAYTAVSDCSCTADIGTFTENASGQSATTHVLCYGDQLTITPNGDYSPPAEATNPPGPAYDPGIGWLVYSCPPTIGLVPNASQDISTDPCLVGVAGFGSLAEVNDLYWITNYPGTFTNNTVYFVPLTFYSMSSLTYSYVNTSTPCYDMGAYYAVQYLPQVTSNVTTDCATGEATATISGGAPAIDGTQFTAVAGSLTPATANFVNTTCSNNGTIVVGGLASGDNYSFDVADANGCAVTISGTFTGGGGATLTYPQNAYCQDATNPSPTVTGSASGSFSASPAGCSINASTGVVNLAGSTPGTYTITYTGSGGACPPSATFSMSINALPTVVAGPDQTICNGTSVTLSGSGALAYSWDNGVSNNVPFTPSATNTYTVTGTTAAGCSATDQVIVTVENAPVPQFTANVTSGCAPLQVTFTNNSGGANCAWDFGDGNQGVGCATVTNTYNAVGCYSVTLTSASAAGCTGSTTMQNYICVVPSPVASFAADPAILTTVNSTTQMQNFSSNATSYAWTFGDGGTSTLQQPTHTYSVDEEAGFTIRLIAFGNGCTDTAYATVQINEELIFYVPNTFTPDGDEFNQTFLPVFTSGYDPYNYTLLIFDRWGEILFESKNPYIGWDGTYNGKTVQEGTYTWKIEFKTRTKDERKFFVGHVNVLR